MIPHPFQAEAQINQPGGVSFPTKAPNGSAAAPSYGFTGSSTGMYRTAGDKLDFATAGVRGLELDTSLPGMTVYGNGASPQLNWNLTGSTHATINWDGTQFNVGLDGDDTGVMQLSGLTGDNVIGGVSVSGGTYKTQSNCASSASPAVCGTAAAGRFIVAVAATTVTVNTSAVTANSEIMVQNDDTLGASLSVTCNTNLLAAPPAISARSNGVSFQITLSAAPVTNPECFTYRILN